QRLGIKTATAASGEEALKKMSARKFDLVFTDLWMPGMSGEALARAIREKPDFSGARIVAVTADTKMTQQENRDFDEILLKPVTMEGLKRVLTVFESETVVKEIS
ncbi:MAG: response regulator, partial [Verrucomicrobia bacterium]|nr:response regulator [Verrucomicrobiota bacterium]